MAFIGTPLDTRNTFQSLVGKRFDGDGSTTEFTLDVAPSSTLDIEVFVGNVRQDPNSAYTLSGTTLTFTGAPPSGTNNIYVVHQAKSVGTIDVPASGVQAGSLASSVLTGQTDIGADIADADLFLVDDGAGGTLRKTAASRIKTYIGSVGGDTGLDVNDSVKIRLGTGNDTELFFDGTNSVIDHTPGSGTLKIQGDQITLSSSESTPVNHLQLDAGTGITFNQDSADLDFRVEGNGNTHLLFCQGGNDTVEIGKDNTTFGNAGHEFYAYGTRRSIAASQDVDIVNRTGSDGYVYSVHNDSSFEGGITFSGGTITYQSFVGSHWSRLADNSKPDILLGTVMESILTLCEWYEVEYEISGTKQKEYLGLLPDGKNVGDNYTVTNDGVDYVGTIKKQNNERLAQCKISDTEDSKAVYGVFCGWDNDDDKVNDMNVAGLGAYIIRIHKDETVAIGDYLQSKGDGTAKKQADDILRASTIGKVTSTTKTKTYDDGSYCVPCTLHCG